MQIVNFDPMPVDTTATGIVILTSAQATAGLSEGFEALALNPDVAIVLISSIGVHPNIPGSKAGTVANSPFVCAANTVTMVAHRGGEVRGISTAGTATTKFALGGS